MNRFRTICVSLLCATLAIPTELLAFPQEPQAASPQKYQLRVIKDASQFRKGKKGRISSEVAVEVKDSNDKPVAGLVVAFTLPLVASGGAEFTTGGMLATVTTNASGIASTSFTTTAGSSFTVGVSASVPGGAALTASVPVAASAAAVAGAGGAAAGAAAGGAAGGAGGGLSTAMIITLVAIGGGVAAGAGIAMAGKGGGSSPTPSTPTDTRTGIRITIGSGISVGAPHP
jgi:hypothetical protein